MCGCTNCAAITSTRGEKGDTGATGPTGPTGPAGEGLTLQNVNVNDSAGIDVYNAGNGYDLSIIASKTAGGVVYYFGEVFVQMADVGEITIKPELNGVADATKITISTFPTPVGGSVGTFKTIPINGTITVPLGQSLAINITGTNTTPLLRTANITFIEL